MKRKSSLSYILISVILVVVMLCAASCSLFNEPQPEVIDEPDTVCAALPVLVKHFSPFMANITRLHLCAFWPTREILSVQLNAKK